MMSRQATLAEIRNICESWRDTKKQLRLTFSGADRKSFVHTEGVFIERIDANGLRLVNGSGGIVGAFPMTPIAGKDCYVYTPVPDIFEIVRGLRSKYTGPSRAKFPIDGGHIMLTRIPEVAREPAPDEEASAH